MAKRRGNREGSITKRANGTYQGRMRYVDPVTGDSKRVSVYGKTSAECRAKLKAVLERIDEGAPARDAKDTVGAWMKRWRTTSLEASDRAHTTRQLYAHISINHLEQGPIADMRLDKLRPTDVEALVVTLRKRYADSTVRSIYTVLRAGLDGAVRDGLLASNPATKVQRPRVEQDESRVLTPSEVSELLAKARTSRYYACVLIMAHTGLRRGEAAALRWVDIDFAKRELRVAHTLARVDGTLTLTTPKTRKSRRRVPMTAELIDALREQRQRQREERLRAGAVWAGRDDMVFTNELGDYVSPTNLLPVVQEAAKAAGLGDDVTPHTLRHSAATAWLEAGIHIRAVADLLGHTSITTTGNLYGHTTPHQARSAVDALALAMGVPKGRTGS